MYKVGTRVKKVRKNNMPSEIVPTGTEGIVVGPCSKYGFDCQVNYRGYGIKVAISSNLEPVIPEGSNVPSEASIHELLDSKFYEKENCNV